MPVIATNWTPKYWTRYYWPIYSGTSAFVVLPDFPTLPVWTTLTTSATRSKFIPVVPRLVERQWPEITRELQDFLRAVKAASEADTTVFAEAGAVITGIQDYIDDLLVFVDLLLDYLSVLPASDVRYDNATSDLSASDVQAALDEVTVLTEQAKFYASFVGGQ
jgi:hypothetical protein